jgi:predicted nucleotidyltransferase
VKRRWTEVALFALVFLFSLSVVAAFALLITGAQQGREDRAQLLERIAEIQQESAEQVAEHREHNQRDHDCIIELALALSDPERDRTRRVEFQCERNEGDEP